MTSKGSAVSSPGSDHSKSIWLAFLRIFIGAYFMHSSWGKFSNNFINGLGILLKDWANHTHFEWYQHFLRDFVIPNAKVFALMTGVGEFCVGLALVLGLLSGLAAIFGFIMSLNYFLATSWQGPSAQCANLTFMICELVIIFTSAGRTLGFDKYLSKKILIRYLT